MRGTAHMLMGAATAAPLSLAADNGWTAAALTAAATIAAVAPDIDQPKHSLAIVWPKRLGWALTSRTRRDGKRKPNILVRLVCFHLLYGIMRGTSRVVRAASRAARAATGTPDDRRAWGKTFDPDHRGLTHTAAAALTAGTAATLAAITLGGTWLIGPAVLLGWLSHLLSDACTRAGVPLCWPIKQPGWRRIEISGPAQWEATQRRWQPFRLLKRLRIASCTAADWYVAGGVAALFVTPTAAIYTLI